MEHRARNEHSGWVLRPRDAIKGLRHRDYICCYSVCTFSFIFRDAASNESFLFCFYLLID